MGNKHPQAKEFDRLAGAARYLRVRPRGKRSEAALLDLCRAFYDVDLPSEPMSLSPSEAKDLSREAAVALNAAFTAAAKRAEMLGGLPAPEFRRLADATDPMWRQLAAARWDVVGPIEADRVEAAREAVMQVASGIAHQSEGRFEDLAEVLSALKGELVDPESSLADRLRVPLGHNGLNMSHFRKALELMLAEH
jgi:hypothetical protein